VCATALSADALDGARANLAGLGSPARRVRIVHGDWYGALPGELAGALDVIVSNPPYVAAHEELPPVVREWEPRDALVPGPTGLEAYESIVAGARRWLTAHGALVLEVGATQGAAVRALARAAGFATVDVRPDLTGRDRVVVAR
jgi:release factor glutamine methyltransferase